MQCRHEETSLKRKALQHTFRAVHNFFHVGGGGARSLDEVVNMAGWKLFTLGASGGMFPQEIVMILGVLRRILVHSEKHTEILEKRLIIKIIIAC